MRKIVIFLLIFLILAAGIAGYWYYKERMFSKEVLKLELLGPETTKMGEEIEYTLRYKNNGDFNLEDATLIFEFPKNSLTEDERTRITENLGIIYPGQEQTRSFKARLLGKEGDLKAAKAWLSYRPKNLNARYESETSFTTKIEFVPLTLEFDLPSKLESAKELQFSLNYFSNLNYTLNDIGIEVEYPGGFEFITAEPRALESTSWEVPVLRKAEGGRIKITGRFQEESAEKKTFRAKLGMWQDGEFVLLKETAKEIEVTKPLLYITQQINGTSDYIASPGEKLNFEIIFRNIGTTPFENQFLITRLEGDALDLATLKADLGDAQPNDNLIVWDWRVVPELRYLAPQQEGKVSFEVKLKDEWQVSEDSVGEAVIKNKVNISQISQEFQTKVNSKLEIAQKGYYEARGEQFREAGFSDRNEIFENEGPIPPKVGKKTTYVIIWQAKNYYNDVGNVRVKATLPENVELTGKIFPEQESSRFSYDPQSREIVWVVAEDTMQAGTGILSDPPNVAFQVALTPDEAQKGKVVPIINEVKIEGEDKWTGATLQNKDEAIDTTLIDDDTVSEEQGVIQ